ncbi:uncharacterized protein LOC100829461 [Brachypodium distachyon]|uniref:uncharacterized protein LOC100829461 n=1 Tax=Brachypodium distachyon TaxID=15368 RepID=UPI00052FF021|nr:uncharacterized protein LOC100829461 [Brachypodium distachyon]|eukprot:XP_010240785.1 uncharacterized protein LOC100829461 [Brachypodium distachyon]
MGHRRFLPPDHEFVFDAESFDGSEEHRAAPIAYAQSAVLDNIKSIKDFEKSKTWKCVSGLFSLPYWDSNLLRHNLDIMHIEKNVCENIYRTLLGIDGKSKDNFKARLDLQEMNIRKELHPQKKPNDKYYLPAASYTMSKKEKQQFCKVLHDLKVPDGEVSAKVLYIEDLEKLEERIIMTLCRMEMIFPPGFFTVMMHLVTHLATEAKIGGPVCYRSMWFVERYLGKLKSNVRNRAHPAGSICEAHLADEAMVFCSKAHADEVTSKRRVNPNTLEKIQNETFHEWFKAHIKSLEEKNGIDSVENDIRWLARGPVSAAKRYRGFISRGFRFRPKRLDKVTQDSGVMLTAKTSSYAAAGDATPVLDDVTYYGRVIDIIELNYSGQFSMVLFECEWVDVFSEEGMKKDKYGYTLVNFSHLIHKGQKIEHEPFIFPNQVDQVFYVEDEMNPGWSMVVKQPKPRDSYDTGDLESAADIESESFHVSHLGGMLKKKTNDQHWVRTNIEGTLVDSNNNAPTNEE